jgi:uncharacterized protein (UPF0276 family)
MREKRYGVGWRRVFTMNAKAIAARVGVGLRLAHMPEVVDRGQVENLWLEIHSETFFCNGGPRLAMLDTIAADALISCHGVGLSLGSAEGLSDAHLQRLCTLHERVRPVLISEHLAWSITGGTYLNDLLPVPYTHEALEIVCRNVARAQDALGRMLLIENPSAYLTFPASAMDEPAFLNALVARTGCGLLLDINNIYVTASNTGGDDPMMAARAYIDAISGTAVGEIHLAGHSIVGAGDSRVLIDTHSTHVCDDVWALYCYALDRIGPRPTLIEWDQDLPALAVLHAEARHAQDLLTAGSARRVA